MNKKSLSDIVAGCICGVVHSGTTITMKMLREHTEFCAPSEGHVLRLKSIEDLKLKKRYKEIKAGWNLDREQVNDAINQKDIKSLYCYLRNTSSFIALGDKNKRIIDKTPSYVYHLFDCMTKSEDVPFIVVKKDPRNFYYSLNRRGISWSKVYNLYKISYETNVSLCKKIFGNRLLVFYWEELLFRPAKIVNMMCRHFGVEFVKDIYTPEFFRKKLNFKLAYSYKKLPNKELLRVKRALGRHIVRKL